MMQFCGLLHKRVPWSNAKDGIDTKVSPHTREPHVDSDDIWTKGQCPVKTDRRLLVWSILVLTLQVISTFNFFRVLTASEERGDANVFWLFIWNVSWMFLYDYISFRLFFKNNAINNVLTISYSILERNDNPISLFDRPGSVNILIYVILGIVATSADVSFYLFEYPEVFVEIPISLVLMKCEWFLNYCLDITLAVFFWITVFSLSDKVSQRVEKIESISESHQEKFMDWNKEDEDLTISDTVQNGPLRQRGFDLFTRMCANDGISKKENARKEDFFRLQKGMAHLERDLIKIDLHVERLMTLLGWPIMLHFLYDTAATSLSIYFSANSLTEQRTTKLLNFVFILYWRILGLVVLASVPDYFNQAVRTVGTSGKFCLLS